MAGDSEDGQGNRGMGIGPARAPGNAHCRARAVRTPWCAAAPRRHLGVAQDAVQLTDDGAPLLPEKLPRNPNEVEAPGATLPL